MRLMRTGGLWFLTLELCLVLWDAWLHAQEAEASPAAGDAAAAGDELSDEFDLLAEEEKVFSAAKHEQKLGFSPAAVIVITRRDILESGAADLMELLRRYPPLQIYVTDPIYTSAYIRGSYRALLIIDGREINLEILPYPFYELLPIGLSDIERLEIVLGPNSALYGANAVSVVFNVTTRRPPQGLCGELALSAGESGNLNLQGRLEGSAGAVYALGSFGLGRADFWMKRGSLAKDLQRANLAAGLELGDARLELNGSLVHGGGRLYAILGYMDVRDFWLPAVKADFVLGRLKARAYWYRLTLDADVDLDLISPYANDPLGVMPRLHLDGDTLHAEGQYDLELFENNLLIAGVDFRFISYRSGQLVDSDIREWRAGAFLHDEHTFSRRLVLTAGVRLDYNSITPFALSPRLTLVVNPAGEHYLRLSAATAFRKPSLMESSMNFRIVPNPAFPEIQTLFEERGLSNPRLGNELLISVELGYRAAMLENRLRLDVESYLGFDRHRIGFTSNIVMAGFRIDMERTDLGFSDRGEDHNMAGLTFSLEGDPVEALTLFLRGEYRYDWYRKTDAWKPSNSTLAYWVGSPFLLSLGATLRLPWGFSAQAAYVYLDGSPNEMRDPDTALAPNLRTQVHAYHYVLLGMNYPLRISRWQLDLGLSLFNPFDGRFREAPGMRASDGSNYGAEIVGRRLLLTVRASF